MEFFLKEHMCNGVKLQGTKGGCERADQGLICCSPKLSWGGKSHDVSSFLWLVTLIQHFQRSLQHENLVRLLGLVIEEGKGGTVKSKIFLVTEFMGKGSLLEYLRSRGRQYVTKKDQIGFAFDTACGMAYLESR